MSVGKRIYLRRELPDEKLLEDFRQLPTSNVCDVINRLSAMHPRIHLMSSPEKDVMAGVALTVKSCAGDNLMLHAALDMAGPGDVIVVSNEGGSQRSLLGEVMMSHLRFTMRAEGIVIDGPIRDFGTLSGWDFPIYATGMTPGGPYKEGPGEINVPIACGNITVNPGDIILGDSDGVVVVPRREAEEILLKAKAYHENDDAKCRAAKAGQAKREWVAKTLAEKGFETIDDIYRP